MSVALPAPALAQFAVYLLHMCPQKLVRCLVVKGVGAGLSEALHGMQVGSRFIVFLPSARALEAVGLADCADEGAWYDCRASRVCTGTGVVISCACYCRRVACDVRVEKYKAREDGGEPASLMSRVHSWLLC
jgi:hypothetical protein